MNNEYTEKLLKFKNRYDSDEFKMLPVDQQKAELDKTFNDIYGNDLLSSFKTQNEGANAYSQIKSKFDTKFPAIGESPTTDLSRKARVAIGNFGQGATELYSGAAALSRGAVNAAGKALGQESDLLPQPEQTMGEKFKDILGVTEAEEQREPGLAIGGRIAGGLVTPLPILKATQAVRQGTKLGLEAATIATGKNLAGAEKIVPEINEAGQVIRKVTQEQGVLDRVQSALNPAVNPQTLNQFLIQGAVYTGVSTVGNKVRTGDATPEQAFKDISEGVFTSLPIYLGGKALSHALQTGLDRTKTANIEGMKAGKPKGGLSDHEEQAVNDLINKVDLSTNKKSTGSVGHGPAAEEMAHVLDDDLSKLDKLEKMSDKQLIDAFKLDDLSGDIRNVRNREKPLQSLSDIKSEDLLESEISGHLGQPNLPILEPESKVLLNQKRLERSAQEALSKKWAETKGESLIKSASESTAKLLNKFDNTKPLTDEIDPEDFLPSEQRSKLLDLLSSEEGSLSGSLDPFNIAQKGRQLANNATKFWDKHFNGIRNNVERPLTILERVGGFEDTVKNVKSAIIDSKRYTAEVLRPHMNALAKLNLRPSEFRQIAQMLDTTDISDILANTSKDPLITKAKLVANFFQESANAAGLDPQRRLSQYFPHIREADPQGWEILEKQFKSGNPYFEHGRTEGSALDNVNIYDVMESYAAGVRRKIVQNLEGELKDLRGALPKGHAAEQAFTILLNNIRRVREGSVLDSLVKNTVENTLRFNVSSSLLNGTQTLQTLLPEVGAKTYKHGVEVLQNGQVVKFLKKLGLEDDLFSRYEVFDDIGDQRTTRKISEIASRKDTVKFLENFDLFKNIEVRNRMLAAATGLIKQAGGKEALEQMFKAGLTREQEQMLLMSAQDMVNKTQFSTDWVNKSNFENNQATRTLLTFMNYPLREAALVGNWIKEGNVPALMYYHGVKIALAGKAGARVLIPAGLEAVLKEVPMWKDYYENFQDSTDFLDSAAIPKYLGLDMSQGVGLLDPTDMNLYQLSRFPIPRALGKVFSSTEDLLKTIGGNGPKSYLTEEEKLLSPEEQAKIQAGESGKRIVKDLVDIAKPVVPAKMLELPLGGKNVQAGIGQIGELVQGAQNVASKRNVVAGIPQKTDLGNEIKRQFGNTRGDVARLTAKDSAKRALSYIESGNRVDKSTMKNLEDAGYSKEEVNLQAKGKLKDKYLDKLIAGSGKEKEKAYKALSNVMDEQELQLAIIRRMKKKHPNIYKKFRDQEDSNFIEGNLR